MNINDTNIEYSTEIMHSSVEKTKRERIIGYNRTALTVIIQVQNKPLENAINYRVRIFGRKNNEVDVLKVLILLKIVRKVIKMIAPIPDKGTFTHSIKKCRNNLVGNKYILSIDKNLKCTRINTGISLPNLYYALHYLERILDNDFDLKTEAFVYEKE